MCTPVHLQEAWARVCMVAVAADGSMVEQRQSIRNCYIISPCVFGTIAECTMCVSDAAPDAAASTTAHPVELYTTAASASSASAGAAATAGAAPEPTAAAPLPPSPVAGTPTPPPPPSPAPVQATATATRGGYRTHTSRSPDVSRGVAVRCCPVRSATSTGALCPNCLSLRFAQRSRGSAGNRSAIASAPLLWRVGSLRLGRLFALDGILHQAGVRQRLALKGAIDVPECAVRGDVVSRPGSSAETTGSTARDASRCRAG